MSSKDLVHVTKLQGDGAETSVPTVALAPLMYAHLLVTGDLPQHRAWRERLEKIEQANELAEVTDPQERALLARPEVWRDIRRMSWWASSFTASYCAYVTANLVRDYAVGFGFGYAAAGTYLLPLPLAFVVGRKLYQQGSLWVMKYLGPNPDGGRQMKSWFRAMLAAFGAGFGFAFTLTFLQGLISWFMTPAPTLFLELWMDVTNAAQAALTAGAISSVMWPLLCRKAPSRAELSAGEATAVPALPAQ